MYRWAFNGYVLDYSNGTEPKANPLFSLGKTKLLVGRMFHKLQYNLGKEKKKRQKSMHLNFKFETNACLDSGCFCFLLIKAHSILVMNCITL